MKRKKKKKERKEKQKEKKEAKVNACGVTRVILRRQVASGRSLAVARHLRVVAMAHQIVSLVNLRPANPLGSAARFNRNGVRERQACAEAVQHESAKVLHAQTANTEVTGL